MHWRGGHFRALHIAGIGGIVALGSSAISTLVTSGWMLAEPTTGFLDEAPEPDEDLAPGSASEAPAPGKGDVADAVVAGNLFCPSCSPAAPGQPPAAIGPSRLPLELLVTMESVDPTLSMATIRDTEEQTLGAYGVSDQVRRGVVLVEIGRGRVTLRNGEDIEIIEVGAELPPPPKSKPDAKAPNPPSPHAIEGAADAIDCKGDHCRVDRAFVEQLLANPGALTKQARISPSKSGFKFYGVRPDSLPKLLGMRNGDTLTHVNGTPLRSLDQAMGLYTKLRRASHLSVTLERKGKSVQKEIDIE